MNFNVGDRVEVYPTGTSEDVWTSIGFRDCCYSAHQGLVGTVTAVNPDVKYAYTIVFDNYETIRERIDNKYPEDYFSDWDEFREDELRLHIEAPILPEDI